MTKRRAMKMVREMMRDDRKFLIKRCEELLNGGGIDIEIYRDDEYILPKVVLYAALGDLRDNRRPLHPEHYKLAKNLKHF